MFRGTFQHSIDAKGRTSLPVKFREVLGQRKEEHLVVTHGPDRCLWCLPPGTWAEFERKVLALPQYKPEVRELIDGVVQPAQDCAVDKMGRILVPPELRAYAGLTADVVWGGAIDRIRLWDAERWRKRLEVVTAKLDDGAFAQTLADLGL